jgi:hypothetical protein
VPLENGLEITQEDASTSGDKEMRWHVGDLAIYIPENRECEITDIGIESSLCDCCIHVPGDPSWHPTRWWAVDFKDLRPIKYDGNQASTWEAVDKVCDWQPQELVM